VCGDNLPQSNYYAGRKRLYCSNACKQKAKRRREKIDNEHFVSFFDEITGENTDE